LAVRFLVFTFDDHDIRKDIDIRQLRRTSASFRPDPVSSEDSSAGSFGQSGAFFLVLEPNAKQKISLHLNYPLDDSYTPSTLCLRAGTSLSDLQDVRILSLEKPSGWITFDVSAELNEEGQE
jgi:hypothetical protein